MKKFKAIIVDDEKLAREDLTAMLQEFEEVQIIGEASSVKEAIELVNNMNPDLIFLDIQMPGQSGFELIPHLSERVRIVFVTAFDEYAIKAFEVNAQDYLLKPVSTKRIALALEHINEEPSSGKEKKSDLKPNDNVFILINNSFQFIKVKSIIKISSAGNYTELITAQNHKGLVLKTMKEWEERLPDNLFVRIHRNTIINLDYVEKVKENFNSSFDILLRGLPKHVTMSRRYASKLKEKMR